jgi:hypothetical protein
MKISKLPTWRWRKCWIFHLSNDKICEHKNVSIWISNHPLQATHITPFVFLTSEIKLPWWLFWCHVWSCRCMNIATNACFFSWMDNFYKVCLMRNRWHIYSYIRKVWSNRHEYAASNHAFNATIYHIHPIVLWTLKSKPTHHFVLNGNLGCTQWVINNEWK